MNQNTLTNIALILLIISNVFFASLGFLAIYEGFPGLMKYANLVLTSVSAIACTYILADQLK